MYCLSPEECSLVFIHQSKIYVHVVPWFDSTNKNFLCDSDSLLKFFNHWGVVVVLFVVPDEFQKVGNCLAS